MSKPAQGVPQHNRGPSILLSIHNYISGNFVEFSENSSPHTSVNNSRKFQLRCHANDPVSCLRVKINEHLGNPKGESIVLLLGDFKEISGGVELIDSKNLRESGLIDGSDISVHKLTVKKK